MELELDYDWIKKNPEEFILMKQGNLFMDSLLMMRAEKKTIELRETMDFNGYVFYEAPEDPFVQLPISFENVPLKKKYVVKLSPEFGVARLLHDEKLLGESRFDRVPSERLHIRKPSIPSFLNDHLQLGQAVKKLDIYDVSVF